MLDYILVDGDIVNFNPTFGLATVVVQPGILTGSSASTLRSKPMCVEGDEANVAVMGCLYTAGAFTIPGVGTLKIDALGSDQVAKQTKISGKAVLLKGTIFTAKFEVQSPAQQPSTPPVTDPNVQYPGGTGSFQTMNQTWRGL